MRVYNMDILSDSAFSSSHHLLFSLNHLLYFCLCHLILLLYFLNFFLQITTHYPLLLPLVLFLDAGTVLFLQLKKHLPLWPLFLLMFRTLYEFNVLLQTQRHDQIILLFSPPFRICYLLNKF